jgi:2,3-bisphosphoglycerate-independent phosphoglycerate mutase
VIVCNIANPDMVGHTGNLDAAILAAEAVDVAIGAVAPRCAAVGGALLITADHGNLEHDARSRHRPAAHRAHRGPGAARVRRRARCTLRAGGALRDVAPTMLDLLGLPQPAEMTGHSLLALLEAPRASLALMLLLSLAAGPRPRRAAAKPNNACRRMRAS